MQPRERQFGSDRQLIMYAVGYVKIKKGDFPIVWKCLMELMLCSHVRFAVLRVKDEEN